MNANQLINMVVRIVMRRLLNKGINAGMDAVGKRMSKGRDGATPKSAAPETGEAEQRLSQSMRATRQVNRF